MLPPRYFLQFGAATLAAVLGCGGEHPSETSSTILEITVATSGDEPDTDGYTIQIDSSPARVVQPAGSIQDRNISAGDHKVYLGGVAENCVVAGANPRSIKVEAEGTTSLTIHITCTPRTGSVVALTRTRGPAPYPPGLTIAVDGIERAAIDTGVVLLENMSQGPHVIQLRGISANCNAQGNPRTVTVRALETIMVEFSLLCHELHGVLEIRTMPQGYQNPVSFAYRLDEGPPESLGSSEALTRVVDAGLHSVELLNIPGNCRVTGPNPSAINVPAAGKSQVVFFVYCEPFAPGSLEVSVSTTGRAGDPDGYDLVVSGSRYHLNPDDRRVISRIQPGDHYVSLLDVSPSCQVDGGIQRIVFVPVGAAAEIKFVVTCPSSE